MGGLSHSTYLGYKSAVGLYIATTDNCSNCAIDATQCTTPGGYSAVFPEVILARKMFTVLHATSAQLVVSKHK